MKKKIVTVMLITVMAAGVFAGCGNKMEEDGKVQAAIADAGNGSSLATETPKSAPEATTEPSAETAPKSTAEPSEKSASKSTVEPSAEPAPKVTAEPSAEPAPKAPAEPTAEPAPKATAEPTAEPAPKVLAEPTAVPAPKAPAEPPAELAPKVTAEPPAEPAATAQASAQNQIAMTTQAQTTDQQPVVSAQAAGMNDEVADELSTQFMGLLLTSDDAEIREMAKSGNYYVIGMIYDRIWDVGLTVGMDELYNTPEFIEQLLACYRDPTTSKSYTGEFLELLNADRRAAGLPEVSAGSDSLEAQALKRAKEFSGELLIGGGASFESMASSVYLSSAYEAFKETEGTYAQLMSENLESISLGRFGNMWALEGVLKSTVIIIDADHPAPEGTDVNIPEEASNEELELKNSTDGTDTYGSSNVTVMDAEDAAAVAEEFGWDWLK